MRVIVAARTLDVNGCSVIHAHQPDVKDSLFHASLAAVITIRPSRKGADDMTPPPTSAQQLEKAMKRNTIVTLGISLAITGFAAICTHSLTAAATQIARNGADDPRGDVKGEGPKHPKAQIARNGADDPRGDVKGEGPKHPKSVVA
jgi:hypothetical protein